MRWPFLVAGLAALAVAATWSPALEDPEIWMFNRNAGLATYAVLGVLLLVSTTVQRTAARLIAGVAAITFGASGAVFMYHAFLATGSPFTFPHWVPLSLAAFLAAFASVRA